MVKVKMLVELEYDPSVMHGPDPHAAAWFFNEILQGKDGGLLLHSNEIGGTIGTIRVIKIEP